jgi:hypothetical protein
MIMSATYRSANVARVPEIDSSQSLNSEQAAAVDTATGAARARSQKVSPDGISLSVQTPHP